MALITDKPENVPTTNALDDIADDLLDKPPAYLAFGLSPAALEDPPAVGEIRTYIVRTRCIGEHGPIERKDGDMRYTRSLSIQACWESGKKPPETADDQGALFDEDGQPVDEDGQPVDEDQDEDGFNDGDE